MISEAIKAAGARIRSWREHPASFAFGECKMELDPWQEEFFNVLPSQDPTKRQIALKACTGPGKSAALAVANLWFISTMANRTQFPQGYITSESGPKLKTTIWAQLATWQRHSQYLTDLFEWSSQKFSAKGHEADWWIAARTWPQQGNADALSTALYGLHAPFVMQTLDECGNIPIPVLQSAQQIFSSSYTWAKLLGGGNPTSLHGALYHMCVSDAASTYSISITADPDDPKRAKRTNIEHAKKMIAMYGRSNPWVMATILGQFPPASINALLGIEEVEAAMARWHKPEVFTWAQKRLGVDCARFGDDRTTLCPRWGPAWMKPVELRAVRTNVIAARIITAVNKWSPRNPKEVLIQVDQTGGWGQGTVDQLIVAGYSPVELVYSTPASIGQYFNIRSQGWMEMAAHVRSRASLPNHPDLKKELTAPTYTLRDGKLFVEPKEFIKDRLGWSPDLGDGWANTYTLPDMPRMAMETGGGRAKTEWDPYESIAPGKAETEFDPYESQL